MAGECEKCPDLELWQQQYNDLRPRALRPSAFRAHGPGDDQLILIVGKADSIRECPTCRAYFSETFKISPLWWTSWCRRSNGYFGSQVSLGSNGELKLDTLTQFAETWFRFLIKQTFKDAGKGQPDYFWYKLNIFTRWVVATKQTILLVFDPRPQIKERLPSPILHGFPANGAQHPFQIHSYLLEELVRLQDNAVWGIRDLVRQTEKLRDVRDAKSYFQLHEVARHAIHMSETLKAGIESMSAMKKAHEQYTIEYPPVDTDTVRKSCHDQTRMDVAFKENMLRSLLERSASNKDRLFNEIQLSFNILTLSESDISIKIGQAAQMDSVAMKTVAFVTMTFLPATYISAIFSMTFFDFDSETNKWKLSSKFWIYWVVSVPVTVASIAIWYYWNKFFPVDLIGKDEK